MALQNVRALLWRGEDLSHGGGNTREVIISTQQVASARPVIITQSFVTSTSLSIYFPSTPLTPTVNGRNIIFVNRSADYWMSLTLNTSIAGGSRLQGVVPVPPLKSFFLPMTTWGLNFSVAANNAWPIPVPLTGASVTTVPLATAQVALSFDLVIEQ